jgi:flagellar biosynthesis anti-sigma factor FlgM
MDIRSSVEGLKTLLGGPTTTTKPQTAGHGTEQIGGSFASDRATVSSAGSEVAQAASESDVRMERVTAVRTALAAGTYSVPASAVAGKVVDGMLAQGQSIAGK